MTRLYELSAEYRAFADSLENCEEITAEQAAILDSIEGDIQTKVRNLIALYRHQETDEMGFDDEIKRLEEKKRSKTKSMKWIKEYLLACLKHANIPKINVGIGTASVRKASRPSIKWPRPPEELPTELQRVKVELNSDKALEMYKAGALPDGFDVNVSEYVEIR